MEYPLVLHISSSLHGYQNYVTIYGEAGHIIRVESVTNTPYLSKFNSIMFENRLWYWVSFYCKWSLSSERQLHWRWSHQITLRMSKPKSKARREFHEINSVSFLLESIWRTVVFPTTTSRRSQHFILSCSFEVACRSLWSLWPEKLLHWRWSRQIPSRT